MICKNKKEMQKQKAVAYHERINNKIQEIIWRIDNMMIKNKKIMT